MHTGGELEGGDDGGSVIPAAVKTPDNKFARIIKPGRIMPAVRMPNI